MDHEHDLLALIRQANANMSAEYARIRARSGEDPGTAGDQGEENWAELLRSWLPATYHVVTKGRVISSTGEASGQLDVFVLSPNYPLGLLRTKLYLAAGVLAVFECKTTLRPRDLRPAIRKNVTLKRVAENDPSVTHAIFSGILAHSSDFPKVSNHGDFQNAVHNFTDPIANHIYAADFEVVENPFESLDLVCVSNVGTWELAMSESSKDASTHTIYLGPMYLDGNGKKSPDQIDDTHQPIGRFLTCLLQFLGEIDSAMHPIANYFGEVGQRISGGGAVRTWKLRNKADDGNSWISLPPPKLF